MSEAPTACEIPACFHEDSALQKDQQETSSNEEKTLPIHLLSLPFLFQAGCLLLSHIQSYAGEDGGCGCVGIGGVEGDIRRVAAR